METVEREIVPGYGIKKNHRHYFPGSGISKFDTVEAVGLKDIEFYASSMQKTYASIDSFYYELILKNEYAGNKVPSGDPERFYNIRIAVKDETDSIIQHTNRRMGEE